jgi:hypothetical protein
MRYDTVPYFESEIQPSLSPRISTRKDIRDAKTVRLMAEGAILSMLLDALVQNPFSGMAERSMSDIMTQRDRLDQIQIQIQCARNGGRDVVHIDHMLDARANMIVLGIEKNLGLMTKSSESLRINDPSRIALERRSNHTGLFGLCPSAAELTPERIRRKAGLPFVPKHRQKFAIARIIDRIRASRIRRYRLRVLTDQKIIIIVKRHPAPPLAPLIISFVGIAQTH